MPARLIPHPLLRAADGIFLALRRLFGPLHRRRATFAEQPPHDFPPLPPEWSDERWFRGDFLPRENCVVRPLVDGDSYFTDLVEALGTARQRVTICGWCLTPLIPLLRGDAAREAESVLAAVLDRASRQAEVYVLLWSGAPALFEPSHRMMIEVQRTLRRIAPGVHCALDTTAPFSHDHHQKAVTIDGRIAYVGGMDLTTFTGDRWDTREHPLRFGPNWHDVQVRLEGGVVQDVEENFCQRWNAVTGEHLEPLPAAPVEGEIPAQIVRTIPKGVYPFALDGSFGIYHALRTAIRAAQHIIYLENQYLWSPEIVTELVHAMDRAGSRPFRIVVVLPAEAHDGKYDNDEHVRLLRRADRGRGMFHAFSLYAAGPAAGTTGYRYLPIYLHAKVSIVDDEWFAIGSANLNRRGLATDSEIDVQVIDPLVARALRIRLWSEHLGLPPEQIAAADPASVVDELWLPAARELESHLEQGTAPPAGQVRTYRPGLNPGSRILDLLQADTLEH